MNLVAASELLQVQLVLAVFTTELVGDIHDSKHPLCRGENLMPGEVPIVDQVQ